MNKLHTLSEDIKAARNIVVLTGAGISAHTGIKTYKDEYLNQIGSVPIDGHAFASLPMNSKRRLDLWERYRHMSSLTKGKTTPCHDHIAMLQDALGATHITTNIDCLEYNGAIKLHGCISKILCTDCGLGYNLRKMTESLDSTGKECVCDRCGEALYPDVVLFGEQLNPARLRMAMSAAKYADLMICIGTSLTVPPSSTLPEVTMINGGKVWSVNFGKIGVPGINTIDGDCQEIIPALFSSVCGVVL